MSLGDDLKEVFSDVGSSYTILKDSGGISGEYLIYEINRQVTKPFVREFFLEAEFAHDTQALVGDIVEFNDGLRYLVVNLSSERFEDEIVEKEGVLYKCNVTSGRIWRSSGEDWDETSYHKDYNFQTIAENVHALMTEGLYGHDLEADIELGQIGLENHEVYLSGDIDVTALDVWEPFSGEYYKVETIKRRRYENILVLEVSKDTRIQTV